MLWLAVFIFCGINAVAQPEPVVVAGVVRDEETREPLPYASLSLKGTPVGTVSNEAGEFSMTISERLRDDTLVVSYVGYRRHMQPLSAIPAHEHLEILLFIEATVLKEVLVNSNGIDANQIIEKAIQSIDTNYPSSPFLMEACFRETLEQDGKCVALTEAALKVYDRHFQRRLNNGITEEVRILEARSSINYADPIVRSVRRQNAIMDLLDNNPVHYTRGLLNTKYFEYKIDSVFQTKDDIVYVIATIPGRHRIYVSEKDYSILKTIEEIREMDTLRRPEFNINDSLAARRMVYFKAISEFQRYRGKMYLKYSNETDAYEILNRTSRTREFLVQSYKEFVVTNLVIDNALSFARNLNYNFKDDIVSEKYNLVFWQTDSRVQLSPLSRRTRKDLEKEMSLPEQFMKMGDP